MEEPTQTQTVTLDTQELNEVIEALRQAASREDIAASNKKYLDQLVARLEQARDASGLQAWAEATTATAKQQWAQVQPQLQKTAKSVSKTLGDRLRKRDQD